MYGASPNGQVCAFLLVQQPSTSHPSFAEYDCGRVQVFVLCTLNL
jgi:hypothetical protein